MTHTETTSLDSIATSDGTFAVVAMDQRNTLKRMYAAVGVDSPPHSELVDIKADVVTALAPSASAFLLDPTYGIPALDADRGRRTSGPRNPGRRGALGAADSSAASRGAPGIPPWTPRGSSGRAATR